MHELRCEVKQSCLARFNRTSHIKIFFGRVVMHQFILRHIFLSKLHSHKHLLLLGERDTDVGLHGLSGLLSHGAGDVDSANRDGGGSSELELLRLKSSNLTTNLLACL